MPDRERSQSSVSVVVLAFNQRKYVGDAIDSILNQDQRLIHEIVIADDASTDGTTEILRDAFVRDSRANFLSSDTNIGMIPNLRRAFAASSGAYICVLEGDDFWTCSNKLRLQVDALEAAPSLAATSHLTAIALPDGSLTDQIFGRDLIHHPLLDFRDIVRGTFPHISSVMFRNRSPRLAIPAWFDHLTAGDWPLLAMAAAQGRVGLSGKVMSAYRLNAESSWHPKPQLEKKRLTLDNLRVVETNMAGRRRTLRPAIAEAHVRVASAAQAAGDSREAASHLMKGAFKHPPTVLSHLALRTCRRPVENFATSRRVGVS